jgi:hypothetical protein
MSCSGECCDARVNLASDTAGAFHEGWFATGDVATRSADGYLHIVGRRATDLIESCWHAVPAGAGVPVYTARRFACICAVCGAWL